MVLIIRDCMRDEDIKVGDVLRIRQWDDMAAEFGTESYLDMTRIKTSRIRFTERMKYMCGATFTISRRAYDERGWFYYRSAEGIEDIMKAVFVITSEMLEPFSNDKEEEFSPLPDELIRQYLQEE